MVVILGIVFLIGIIWWFLRAQAEPVYQGKRLSVWLQRYDYDGNPTNSAGADEAVRGLGTNSIPILLQLLQSNDSMLKTKLTEFVEQQDVLSIHWTEAETLRRRAVAGFKVLGSNASSSVPELIKIYNQSTNQSLLWDVSDCLSAVGPAASNAIPSLLAHAVDGAHWDRYVRSCAISALGEIHSQPEKVVATLTGLLHDSDPDIQCGAAIALSKYGSKAEAAVPVLVERFNNGAGGVHREQIREAIRKIDPDIVGIGRVDGLKP